MMNEEKQETFWNNAKRQIRSSITAKLLLIGLILLLCQIPVLMISGLTRGRERLAESVEREISEKWGGRQYLTGPVLTIPLEREVELRQKDGVTRRVKEHSACYVVPDHLTAKGTLFPEIRYRGIYEVVLYRSKIVMKGDFSSLPAISDKWQPQYQDARLTLGIHDIKGITAVEIRVDGKSQRVLPGTGSQSALHQGVSVKVGPFFRKPSRAMETVSFEITLELNGCRDLCFWPVGRTSKVELASAWPTPSFCGAFLPQQREVTEQGFRAEWAVSEFNRNCPASWTNGSSVRLGKEGAFGVSLLKQTSTYSLVKRAVSYDILVYLIVLMAFLIAERLVKSWIHPLQYLVAGLSLVLFYCMLLALSEHIGFNPAFLAAAAITAALAFFYSWLIFRKHGAALLLAGVTAAAYAVIFVILQLEDYALLAGAGALLVLLIVLMVFTGRINRSEE